MTSIPRLMKYMNHDHATSKERLLFTQRKSWWRNKLIWYPVTFFLLWVMWAVSAWGATVWGTANGKAFVLTVFQDGPLQRFTVTFGERR